MSATATPVRTVVTITGHDPGPVYLFWQWGGDSPSKRRVHRIEKDVMAAAQASLKAALPIAQAGESVEDMVGRVLGSAAFSGVDGELELARELAAVLLPDALATELADAWVAGGRQPLRVHLMPPPPAAQVPWELLPITVTDADGTEREARLVEIADLVYEVPGGVLPSRARSPRAWTAADEAGGALFVIDPITRTLGRVLDDPGHEAFRMRSVARGHRASSIGGEFTRGDLHRALTHDPAPGRLVYVGHVHMAGGNPALAGLVLSDGYRTYGTAPVIRSFSRPLSAIDLIEGTRNSERRMQELAEVDNVHKRDVVWPAEKEARLGGAQIWPIPPRVLLVACNSGGDMRSAEPFGLVVALVNAGAEYVVATKWTLPTDEAFREFAGDTSSPLQRSALELDDAHRAGDVVRAVADWQRARLRDWVTTGDVAASPIIWSAFSSFRGSDRLVGTVDGSDAVKPRLDDQLVDGGDPRPETSD